MFVIKVINWEDTTQVGKYIEGIYYNGENEKYIREYLRELFNQGKFDEFEQTIQFTDTVENALSFENKKEANDFIRINRLNIGTKNFEIELPLQN